MELIFFIEVLAGGLLAGSQAGCSRG